MTILYINNEHCRSLAQLRGYFNLTLNPLDEVYQDLLDSGRDHIIFEWLQDQGETELAMQLKNVDSNLCDSEYFAKMSAIILESEDIKVPGKTEFSQCFTLENIDQDEDAQGKQIIVKLKVLLSVNESYELRVQTSWGTKATNINPFKVAEGDFIKENFHFRKRPGKDFEVLGLFADGEQLETQEVKAKPQPQGSTYDDDFVDLGLSVKWAKCNLGAKSPEEYGNYYAWGETEPINYNTKGCTTYREKMSCISGDPQYDAVTAAFGQRVRLPTLEEIEELVGKCSTELTTQNGVRGQLITGPNGNSIFLPATGFMAWTCNSYSGALLHKDRELGCYWGGTPSPYSDKCSCRLYFTGYAIHYDWYGRHIGFTVRPVREFKE